MGHDLTGIGEGRAAPGVLLDRREFLRLTAAAGIAAASVATAHPVSRALAASPEPSSRPPAADPVADLAASLGHERDRIFRFVADEVGYEPYPGVLRGARGTLLARAGNSADQALLLADLLTASGISVRFVSGPLDEATGQAMMATTVVDPETAQRLLGQALISDEDVAAGIDWSADGRRIPADTIVQLPDLQEFRTAIAADQTKFASGATTQLQRTLDMLVPALAGAGIHLPMAVSALPASEQATHVWVQAGDGSGWLDLDPSIPGTAPGTAAATPSEPYTDVPTAQRHIVDFAVTAETLQGGALTQQTILQASAFADELAHVAVVFSHLPAGTFADIPIIGSVGAGTLYQPVLLLGDSVYVAKQPVSIGGSGGDLFGDALGGGGEGLVEGETGAEWLDVTVTSPGAAPRVARRTIFDRVGSTMRDSGTLDVYSVPPAELVDTPDGATAQYLPCRAVRALSVTSAPPNLKALVEGATKGAVSLPALLPGAVEVLRNELAGQTAALTGCRPYGDAPSVLGWVLEENADGPSTERLDIWHRNQGSLGIPGMSPSAPPALVAGIIPHVVERLALGEVSPDGTATDTGTASVGGLFEATVSQGIAPLVFSGSVPANFPFQGGIRASVERAIDAGWTVVTPGRVTMVAGAPRLGWWLIDPATGAAMDQMDDGGGNSEKVIISTPYLIAMATKLGWQAIQNSNAPELLEDVNIAATAERLLTLLMELNPGWY